MLLPGFAVAQEKPELTVYTYESFVSEWGPGPKIKDAFEKVCACTVNFVGVADGVALLNRLKLEGAGSKADVVVGLDTNLVAEAKQTGLFDVSGVDASAAKVPGGYEDDVFVPYDYGHFAIVYDTQTLKSPPTSLKELVEGDPAQKIAIQDPRTSTPGLGLLLWVKSVYGDQAPEAWAKLRKRILTVTPGWSESYGLFTKGRCRWCCPTRLRPPIIWSPKSPIVIRPQLSPKDIISRSKCQAFSKTRRTRISQSSFSHSPSPPVFRIPFPKTTG